jgi:LysM repeat protein
MKVRFVIKEQDENKPVQSPEEINIERDNLKSEIQSELTALNLTTVTPEQLQDLLNQIKVMKGESEESLAEKKKMTKSDEKKREKYVKGMKSSKKDFEKRYGKDAEDVMYATATKMAMKKK